MPRSEQDLVAAVRRAFAHKRHATFIHLFSKWLNYCTVLRELLRLHRHFLKQIDPALWLREAPGKQQEPDIAAAAPKA
jgi:hypothetical protein